MRRLLASSAPVTVRVGSGTEAGDPEIVTMQQGRLLALSLRTLALSYGRGALTLGANKPVLAPKCPPLPILTNSARRTC